MSLRGIELVPGATVSQAALRDQGYGFVVGSLGSTADGHLSAAQARDFLAAGLAIVSVYDAALQTSDGTTVDYDPRLFEDPESLLHTLAYRNGSTDGRAAFTAAKAAGQPAGSAIYFEINADVTAGIAYVQDYFRGIAEGLSQAAAGQPGYRIGVYGSGFVLDAVYNAGLADFKWLAAAPAWHGSADYAAYDIAESTAGDPALPDAAFRTDITSDSRPSGDVGQWTTSAAVPNLVINDLATRTPPQPAGGTVVINFAIGNAGTAISDSSSATLYLSTDDTITADDIVLGVFDVPSLATKGATAGSLSWTIPADTAPATYYIGIAAASVPGESSKSDNLYAIPYTVTASADGNPNMVINFLSLGASSVPAGGMQTISFAVGNAGASATIATNATLYLSTDATITPADTFLGAFPIPALAPQAAAARSMSATLPAGLAQGTYYIGVVAGPVAGESNVNDNTYATSFTVGAVAQGAPNLVINDLALGSAVAPVGGTQTIDIAIGNAGTTDSAAASATVYLSSDATISAGDMVLGSFALPVLAAGAASTAHLVSAIPATLAEGTYHIGVVADPVPGEPNTNDNTYAVPFTVARVAGTVSVSDVTISEGDSGTTQASFLVTRSNGTLPFDLAYATADAGATADSGDYAATSGTLSFAENELVRTLTVAVNGDLVDESQAPETFLLTLSAGTNGVAIARAQAKATIVDDDLPNHVPTLTGHDMRIHAGQAASAATMIQSVSDPDHDTITQYAFRDGTAGGGFLRASGIAQPAGEWATVAAADLATLAYVGGATEAAETIDIRVFDGKGWSEITQVTATTIPDGIDDHGETPESAGNLGADMFASGTLERPQDADWFAMPLIAGERYEFNLEGAATGQGTLSDPVLELRDAAGALVQLGMQHDSGHGTLARLVHTATANDTLYLAARGADDTLGTYRLSATARPYAHVSIAAQSATRPEGRTGTTPFAFTITRDGNLGVAADITYAVSGAGEHQAAAADFAANAFPSGTVAFLPGETSKTVTIAVAGDAAPEDNDAFTVAIASDSPDVAITNATAGGMILDDDTIADLVVLNTITGQRVAAAPRFYDGPVAGLDKEVILITSENVNITVGGDNWFICAGSGMDALAAHGGRNVLDGGTGSNFLCGGAGEDTFFLDARAAEADIWNTILQFGSGDSVTVWGVSPDTATIAWADDLGVDGYRGLTLQASAPGKPAALVTLAGYTRADLDSGRLSMVAGNSDQTGPYLYIH